MRGRRTTVSALAATGLALAIATTRAADKDYRSALLTCVRHYECADDLCRSDFDCDVGRLSAPDRRFLESHEGDLSTTTASPDEVTDSLISENDAASRPNASDEPGGSGYGGSGYVGVDGGLPVGQRRRACPERGCAVVAPRSTTQTAVQPGQPQTAIVPNQPQVAVGRGDRRTFAPSYRPQTALPAAKIGKE